MDKILRINVSFLTGPKARYESLGVYAGLGGRALAAKIASEEIPDGCHPLGPENKLILAPGLLCGSPAVTTHRLSVGCISPLTGMLKIANSTAEAAGTMARLGIAAIILEGNPATKDLFLISIDANEIRIAAENGLRMRTNYELIDALKPAYGDSISVVSIGTAGEMRMASSTIAFTDPELRPTRHAGRGGTGAVMGSKGIKAIILNPSGTTPRKPANPDLFQLAHKAFIAGLGKHPLTADKRFTYGTNTLNRAFAVSGGGSGAHNTRGFFSGAAILGEAAFAASHASDSQHNILSRTCPDGEGCDAACLYPDMENRLPVSEAVWAPGGSCGFPDEEDAGTLAFLADTYGLDALEIVASLSLVMEAGLLRFGDMEGAVRLVHEIGKGTPLGRLLGAGAASVAKAYGLKIMPSEYEHARPLYEACFADNPADTHSGVLQQQARREISGNLFHFSTDSAGRPLLRQRMREELLSGQQGAAAAMDALGCSLAWAFVVLDQPDTFVALVEMVNGFCGTRLTTGTLLEAGTLALKAEQEYTMRSCSVRFSDRSSDITYALHTSAGDDFDTYGEEDYNAMQM